MVSKKLAVLVIEDDEDDLYLTTDHLKNIDTYDIIIDTEINYKKARAAILQNRHDVYIVDYLLGPHTGVELIRECVDTGINKPFILLTGRGDKKIDIDATKAGAYDYLTKSELNTELLERSLRYSLQRYSAFITIAESERRYREIFTRSNDIIFVLDEQHNIVNNNPTMSNLLGFSADELNGRPFKSFFEKAPDAESFFRHIEISNDSIEIVLLNKAGVRKIFLASCSKIDSHNGAGQYHCILTDYTNIKKAMSEQLQRETTDKLVQSLAHEIRTPLTNINLSTHQLEPDLNEDKRLYTEIIKRNCKRINDLIIELMNLRTPLDKNLEEIELHETVDATLAIAKDRLALKKIDVFTNFAEHKIFIMGDSKGMQTALLNIIINAVEAMEEGKGKLGIDIAVRNNRVSVKISDNGGGIPPENMAYLFQPYYTNKKNGLGLGLATTQSVIAAHKGVIEVESNVGAGTVFTITLETTRMR
jgi:PAS domain S-box-containing protein